MRLLLTSFCTTVLLFIFIGSDAQSYPGSRADSARANPHPPPNKTGASHAATIKPVPPKAAATSSDPDPASSKKLTDPSIPQSDDEFNIFLISITIAFFGMVIGGALIGAFVATLLLLSLLALVSAGILSAGILTGLYRRSIAAGFKTILVIVCSLGGIIGGTICFWLINRIYDIHLISSTAALVGAFGGLLCGLLLGFLLAGILRIFMNYCRQKLSF